MSSEEHKWNIVQFSDISQPKGALVMSHTCLTRPSPWDRSIKPPNVRICVNLPFFELEIQKLGHDMRHIICQAFMSETEAALSLTQENITIHLDLSSNNVYIIPENQMPDLPVFYNT
jgi:hypothetical protein